MEAVVKRLLAAAAAAAVLYSFAFFFACIQRLVPEESRAGRLVEVEYAGGCARISICGYVVKLELAAVQELADCARELLLSGFSLVPRFIPDAALRLFRLLSG